MTWGCFQKFRNGKIWYTFGPKTVKLGKIQNWPFLALILGKFSQAPKVLYDFGCFERVHQLTWPEKAHNPFLECFQINKWHCRICRSIKQGISQHKAGKNLVWHQSFASLVYSDTTLEGSFQSSWCSCSNGTLGQAFFVQNRRTQFRIFRNSDTENLEILSYDCLKT